MDAEATVDAMIAHAPKLTSRKIEQSKECGGWLLIILRSLNGTVLDPNAFRDSLRI